MFLKAHTFTYGENKTTSGKMLLCLVGTGSLCQLSKLVPGGCIVVMCEVPTNALPDHQAWNYTNINTS